MRTKRSTETVWEVIYADGTAHLPANDLLTRTDAEDHARKQGCVGLLKVVYSLDEDGVPDDIVTETRYQLKGVKVQRKRPPSQIAHARCRVCGATKQVETSRFDIDGNVKIC